MKMQHFYEAFKTTLPVFFGYIAIGVPFGLMVINAGYSWWLAPVMSTIIYAGAGQYIAIGLFAAGAQLSTIIIAEFFINIRHIFYGLSLISKFKKIGAWKFLVIFGLTDETYSLLTTCSVPSGCSEKSFYVAIAVLDHLYWILGGVLGAVAGTLIPFSFDGVDFALTALFAVLLISQIEKTKTALPPIIGGASAFIAIALAQLGVLPSEHILLVSLALGVGTLILFQQKNRLSCQAR